MSGPNFGVLVDDKKSFEDMKGSTQIKCVHASDGNMKPKTCDHHAICNRVMRPQTPQRRLINLLNRVSGLGSVVNTFFL